MNFPYYSYYWLKIKYYTKMVDKNTQGEANVIDFKVNKTNQIINFTPSDERKNFMNRKFSINLYFGFKLIFSYI